MKPVPFPTCVWVTENLLVGGIDGFTVELPAAAVKGLRSAGVGHPFEIPFFDEDAGREEDFRGGRVLTYRSADLPAHARAALHAYLNAEAELAAALRERDRTGHYLYVRRGVRGNARAALFQTMGDWKPFPPVSERTW